VASYKMKEVPYDDCLDEAETNSNFSCM